MPRSTPAQPPESPPEPPRPGSRGARGEALPPATRTLRGHSQVLSEAECAWFIEQSERAGFEDVGYRHAAREAAVPDSNEPFCMLNRQHELTLPRLTAAPTATSSAHV